MPVRITQQLMILNTMWTFLPWCIEFYKPQILTLYDLTVETCLCQLDYIIRTAVHGRRRSNAQGDT